MNSYDVIRYPTHAKSQTHPDRLATIGTLFGMKPAPVGRCRVLELGCGSGGNLIPMAYGLPESRFVGIDLAAEPIAQGRREIEALGLSNIRLCATDILDLTRELGEFDYIIAHGVYSWVPEAVRERMMEICRSHLSPDGVAYISYNAMPGGHLRLMFRDMMRYHIRRFPQPQEQIRQARALAHYLGEAHTGSSAYGAWIAEEAKGILERDPAALFHDDLAEVNHPVYFSEFLGHARAHELEYLGEADFSEMQDLREAFGALGDDPVEREQYLDFLKGRRFRQTLLCRAGVPVAREVRHEQMRDFLFSSPARQSESDEAEFKGIQGVSVRAEHPLARSVLLRLGEIWPRRISPAELRRDLGVAEAEEEVLSKILLDTYRVGLLQAHSWAPEMAVEASERPVASAVARLALEHGELAVNLCHLMVHVEDALGRALISLLDGTRDRAALVRELARMVVSGGAKLEKEGQPVGDRETALAVLSEGLEGHLAWLARMGLLVA